MNKIVIYKTWGKKLLIIKNCSDCGQTLNVGKQKYYLNKKYLLLKGIK